MIVLLGVLGLQVTSGTPAWAGPTFPVMNTSETPPDGVYFRSDTNMASAIRITGFGVYRGERVEAVCYAHGEQVGPYHNDMWYYAKNATRATVGGRSNEGWINTHYVDDGQTANHAAPGVSSCSSPPPSPVGAYLSPFNHNDGGGQYEFRFSTNTKAIYRSTWDRGRSCDSQYIYDRIKAAAGGRPVDHLASWSLSKITPMYFMYRASTAELARLNYVLMIDPGRYSDFPSCANGSGSSFDAGMALVRWLKANPNARMIVIAGSATDATSRGGIQNILFNDVRNNSSGTNIRSRIGVCEYPGLNHDPQSFRYSEWYIERPISTTGACPTLENNTRPSTARAWNP